MIFRKVEFPVNKLCAKLKTKLTAMNGIRKKILETALADIFIY